jgi:hypothetical protein
LIAFEDEGDPRSGEVAAALGAAFDADWWPESAALTPPAADDLPIDAADLSRALRAGDALLTQRAIERVRGLEGAGPALLEIAVAGFEDAQVRWATVHAIDLLGELAFTPAIPALLRMLTNTQPDSLLLLVICQALSAMGPALVEPALAAHPTAPEHAQLFLREALASADVQDPRIRELLLTALEEGAPMYASQLADYGDPSTVPALLRALEREGRAPVVDPETIVAIEAALRRLGHELPRSPRAPAAAPKRPGRNEACWCGSGRKYKKCHLDQDEASLG